MTVKCFDHNCQHHSVQVVQVGITKPECREKRCVMLLDPMDSSRGTKELRKDLELLSDAEFFQLLKNLDAKRKC